jgi:hypothetical protein
MSRVVLIGFAQCHCDDRLGLDIGVLLVTLISSAGSEKAVHRSLDHLRLNP